MDWDAAAGQATNRKEGPDKLQCFFGGVYSRDLAAASRKGVTLKGMQQVFEVLGGKTFHKNAIGFQPGPL